MEHLFFFYSQAQDVWRLAPLHWDGLADHRGNFNRWWSGLMEAKSTTEGADQQALTVNILWQLWKAKNDRMFNNRYCHAFEIVQKAQLEWMEFTEAWTKDK